MSDDMANKVKQQETLSRDELHKRQEELNK